MQAGMGEGKSLVQGLEPLWERGPLAAAVEGKGRLMRPKKIGHGHPGHRWDQPLWAPNILEPSPPSTKGFLYPGLGEAEREKWSYRHFPPERTTSKFWQTNLDSALGTKTICLRPSKYLYQTCNFINVFSSLYEFVLIFKDLHHIYVKFIEEKEENSCQLRMQEIVLLEVLALGECGVSDARHQCRLAGHCIFVDSAVSVQEKVRSYREVILTPCCHTVL